MNSSFYERKKIGVWCKWCVHHLAIVLFIYTLSLSHVRILMYARTSSSSPGDKLPNFCLQIADTKRPISRPEFVGCIFIAECMFILPWREGGKKERREKRLTISENHFGIWSARTREDERESVFSARFPRGLSILPLLAEGTRRAFGADFKSSFNNALISPLNASIITTGTRVWQGFKTHRPCAVNGANTALARHE